MRLYPDEHFKKVEEISIEFLNRNNIKALILDADNTLIDYNKKLEKTVEEWVSKLREQGMKFYILSNTNNEQKIIEISEKLQIKEYIYFAKKPFKSGFLKIQKELNINAENIAVVGDQIFTDIIGGNRCKMFTILVDPIMIREFWYTAWKRPLEAQIMKKFYKQRNKVTKEKK